MEASGRPHPPEAQGYRPPQESDLALRWLSWGRTGHQEGVAPLRCVRGPLAAVPQGVHAPSPLPQDVTRLSPGLPASR